MNLRLRLKRLVFPGFNLHARQRYRVVSRHISRPARGQERWVLDAGCGNGMLSYAAWKKGNLVIGITLKQVEVEHCRRFFNQYLQIPETEMSFLYLNIMEVEKLGRIFDEIICCEVIEHIHEDRVALQRLRSVHREGGLLHLTVPNAEHPDNRAAELDLAGGGGHVRPGYNTEQLRELLAACGYEVLAEQGLGGKWRQRLNRSIIRLQKQGKAGLAVLLWLVGLVASRLDEVEPRVPYILYVRARAR